MAQLPLNVFKTITAEVGINTVGIYTAPSGYSSIILYSHVSNVGASTATFTLAHNRGAVETELIKGGAVPPNDAYVPTDGKVVLESSDYISIVGSSADSLKLVVSILETANA